MERWGDIPWRTCKWRELQADLQGWNTWANTATGWPLRILHSFCKSLLGSLIAAGDVFARRALRVINASVWTDTALGGLLEYWTLLKITFRLAERWLGKSSLHTGSLIHRFALMCFKWLCVGGRPCIRSLSRSLVISMLAESLSASWAGSCRSFKTVTEVWVTWAVRQCLCENSQFIKKHLLVNTNSLFLQTVNHVGGCKQYKSWRSGFRFLNRFWKIFFKK